MELENKEPTIHLGDVTLNFQFISDRITYAVQTPHGRDIIVMISGYDLKIG